MHINYIDLAASIFQLGLFILLLATLIYARRLDRSLRQVRTDHEALQTVLPHLDASISAAVIATDRLVHESREADSALKEACASAEAMTRKLDESMSRAALTTSALFSPPDFSAPLPAPATVRPLAQRRTAKLQSHVERDLARVLLDAS